MITKSSQVIRDPKAAAELANVLKFTSRKYNLEFVGGETVWIEMHMQICRYIGL
jgi:hypothetical protein